MAHLNPMIRAPKDSRETVARAAGFAAGLGALLAAGVHQGFGGPEVNEVLARAQGEVPPLFLAQIDAVWVGATLLMAMLGAGLIAAALRYQGWLVTLGRAAAVWFAGLGLAFIWSSGRWCVEGLAAQAWLVFPLAALAALASALADRRRHG